MGFINSVMGAAAAGGAYDAQKRRVLVEGEAARAAAESAATAKGVASKRELHVVAENMARAAGNKRRDMASARVAGMGSGFTGEGSGGAAEQAVGRAYDLNMADMARAGSERSMQALHEQVALQRRGAEAVRAAEAEARQLSAMAKASRTGAWFNALGGVAGGVVGAYQGLEGAFAEGNVSDANLKSAVMGGFVSGSDGGSGLMASANPFTAQFAGDGWDKRFMGLLGVGKIN